MLVSDDVTRINLFTYCENNPVNKYDDGGDLSKWAYLKWPGAIHAEVQQNIVDKNPGLLKEITVQKINGKTGRIDLLDPVTNEIWEIKPVTRAALAGPQAESYLGDNNRYTAPLHLGFPRFFGQFTDISGVYSVNY